MKPISPRSAEAPSVDVERSRVALRAARVGTWSWEAASRTVDFDHEIQKLFGLEPGTFSGKSEDFFNLVHPDDRERVRREMAEVRERTGDYETEYRVVWPDGTEHWLRSRGKIYRDEEGHVVRMAGACWDISHRKKMEDELAFERHLLRTLMENVPDKIYFKDLQSRFIRVSNAKLHKSGLLDPQAMVGKTDFDFFSDEHARQAYEDEQRIIASGQPLVDVEEKETWPDGGESWASTTKMPLHDQNSRVIGTFGISRDITGRKLAEAQLERYVEELRKKNQELEEDLEMARELQAALLPQHYPNFPHTATAQESALHFSHFFNPSTAVSGDFFDILNLSDTMAGMFICDVMGHGVRAALVAASVRALVEEFRGVGADPGEFMAKLNRALLGILKQAKIPMFASAFYVVADLEKGELRYANAGHPSPLCVKHNHNGVAHAEQLNHHKRGPVLGMFEKAEYQTSSCPLSLHDMVLLFTDGLFEVEGADGDFYDESRLLSAVNRRIDLPAVDLCTEVVSEIQQFSASKHFSDDVCLVTMKVEHLDAAARR